MRKILILVALLSGCVTIDKLRIDDCEEVLNKSPIITKDFYYDNSLDGILFLCADNTDGYCCLSFAEERVLTKNDIMDGTCYRGGNRYAYKTFCEEK